MKLRISAMASLAAFGVVVTVPWPARHITGRDISWPNAETWSGNSESKGAAIFAEVSPSVVRVEADLVDGSKMVGSGFLTELKGKKLIVTNRHVVEKVIRIRVGATGSVLEDVPSYQLSQKYDLALIEPPPGVQGKALKSRTEAPKPGERIYVIGFPAWAREINYPGNRQRHLPRSLSI